MTLSNHQLLFQDVKRDAWFKMERYKCNTD